MIVFDEVLKSYLGRVVLNRISFTIRASEFVSIVGKSGSGKTTIAKLLLASEKPEGGKVTVDGLNVHKQRGNILQLYRRKVGMIFQDYKLLEQMTAFENIAFALRVCGTPNAEIKRRVPELIKLVNLEGFEHKFPRQLSGVEKQRVAIALALVHHPKLIIADEPTGNLDPENTWDIINLLKKINAMNTTVILTTHNMDIVRTLDKRVIVLENGLITEEKKETEVPRRVEVAVQ